MRNTMLKTRCEEDISCAQMPYYIFLYVTARVPLPRDSGGYCIPIMACWKAEGTGEREMVFRCMWLQCTQCILTSDAFNNIWI